MDIRKIEYLFKREFDTKQTIQVLTHDRTIYWSWGVSKLYNCHDKALLLKVNGRLHSDYVLITLEFNDTYNIHYLNSELSAIDKIKGIYSDQLVEVIDERIEQV